MEQKDILKTLLCTPKQLEEGWNISQNPNNNNVYNRYIRNPKKYKQLRRIDMGNYCIMNDITPDLLKVFVENGKRIVDVLAGKGSDVAKDHNKVVVMSEEEYKTYELFKEMQAFREAKR